MEQNQMCPGLMPPANKISLAMAYVPMQQWCKIYPSDVGFTRGTIFEQLDLPFIGEEAVPNGK